MAREQGANARLAVAFESTYGTAPASGFRSMPFASTTLGQEQPLLANDLLGNGRDPVAPTRDAITADGNVIVPVDAENLGVWLRGAFGAPVTTGAGPYDHEFRSGAATLPSLSIEKWLPGVPMSEMFTGCVVDTLSWTMQRAGLLTMTVGLVAQGRTKSASAQSGTLASAYNLVRFGHFNGSIARDGSALGNVESASITYSNNLDRIETIRSDGRIDGADPTVAALSGEITVRFANTTLLDQAIDGEPCELVFTHALAGGEEFVFTAHAVYLPTPRIPIEGPGGIRATFAWQAAKHTSPARMCTAVLTNDVASYA
ncbi:MAG: phage tail tube protein [Rhodobacteraceae bacterium]|jgi:hypothetical protein|nr:phage tail tube protein [Paracoccaceae bacterium]